jgi:hypothetical protein
MQLCGLQYLHQHSDQGRCAVTLRESTDQVPATGNHWLFLSDLLILRYFLSLLMSSNKLGAVTY